jgi:putative membrane protein
VKAALYGAFVVAQDGNWDDGHMDWDDGWWIVMMLGMLVFLALVVVGIVWLVHSLQDGGRPRWRGEPTPLELLDRRLAEGAISVEEYEQRRSVLLGSSGKESGG